ncbi:uncharacterized protein LOC124297008 isoform X1 [Neodiprion virginianus]|uniref:uncharacterized protein LOC124297008 isoform X1 n=2 Tax=Neodiprion virginianus TaxID=2961670 RepID=UPI001EE746ED|nr:uncharacterized protein LOC124297008 isoform X1 [Neodiprion virginianus]XP_046603522.1 uncharacterized protein LOC124297008 isoform X1 [Neodiprion virginianus]XP_046603529.1 uncharacterized protein LOC124297008 isoform X1 [Neodiprion virginianus]XP_046603539.1 uncharacterized protein LOC124297008 isoform X1 [Neodiprion virginianus]
MPTPTPTPTETGGGEALAVLAGDVLVLRGAGLAAPETWALLCQAAQALQDLFLSNGGVVGSSGMGPVVTPHTLELTPRGRVILRSAPPETARAYLPPEYRPGRTYSDTDSEKMWMYSLGRALLDTTPRGAALTGTGSVSPSSALQSVLAAMTEPDPRRRASLMNLLDVISEYCRTRLQTKPFSHIVMDMYREVVRCPQYAARKRVVLQGARLKLHQGQQQPPPQPHFPKHHQGKGALFKAQSRNSRSQPNLLSLPGCERSLENGTRPEFQSQMNIPGNPGAPGPQHHARTNSQPVRTDQPETGNDLLAVSRRKNLQNSSGNIYSDPIYSLPVKPFLSTQDVRSMNGAKPLKDHSKSTDVYGQTTRVLSGTRGKYLVHGLPHHRRETSNTQSVTRANEPNPKRCSGPPQLTVFAAQPNCDPAGCQDPIAVHAEGKSCPSQEKSFTPRGPVPPKPPRIITTLKRMAPASSSDVESGPPVKPPRSTIRCGPKARRGKAVQRAPSRLYRAVGGPTRSLNKTRCVGPEFVVRANQQPKQLVIGDVKIASSSRVVVILLTGQRLEVTCDPQKITAGELFQAVVQAENLEENFTLGLAALLAGDFAILPPDTKLNKVAPPGWLNNGKNKGLLGLPTSFMLYFRLRFFLPSLRGIRSWCSKHLLYLQLRRCILEQQLICSLGQLISLTGLALQAEFGNYSTNEHGCGDYFLLEHYVPESLVLSREQIKSELSGSTEALRAQLHQAHRERFGLDTNKAEETFIEYAQSLGDYGAHYYIATVDIKELGKVLAQQMGPGTAVKEQRKGDAGVYADTENIYDMEKSGDDPIYGKIDFPGEDPLRIPYSDEQKIGINEELYAVPKPRTSSTTRKAEQNNNVSKNNKMNNVNSSNGNNHGSGLSKAKKSNESGVWLAIHADGLKLFDRGGSPREKIELARFQWRDIQTLSYSKSCLIVHTKLNGKRCKFKLRMDHRKSYFAFKLTSLHHQFFLKFRAELTSLQGLAAEFGVPLIVEPNSPLPKSKPDSGKNKISIAEATKKQERQKFSMQLEEYQNKENENPQKKSQTVVPEPIRYTPEEDALYAQVHARLEPEGASRDTEDESDRGLIGSQHHFHPKNLAHAETDREEDKLYAYAKIGPPGRIGHPGSLSKPFSSDAIDLIVRNPDKPEDIYAAINKTGQSKKFKFPVPEEVWDVTDVTDVKKTSQQVKTSSLPNYGTPRQMTGFRTPSLPRRLGVKMGTRAIYSSLQRDPNLADVTSDLESLSLKSDTTSSAQSASADSPLPEAYVLNADIRSDDETFRVPIDETMSASLMARLDELSFAEERILHSIQLERGHGGSIGLQVTEGNDGGVYVQAVSVGGSADMAGNVNKGDRIVAINGQSLLSLRYEEALKMLQSSAETVDLVLSQIVSRANPDSHRRGPIENNYLQNIRFDMASELDSTNTMATKWLGQRTTQEVGSVQNTSSAYSSASSSAMGNHRGMNTHYLTDVIGDDELNSASILLGIEDFDLSRTSRQVFI